MIQGVRPREAELLAVMRHVRFVAMSSGFLRETVGAWPALSSAEARGVLFNAVLPAVDGTKPVRRSGFGPRLIYVVGGRSSTLLASDLPWGSFRSTVLSLPSSPLPPTR